jgi:hypothetical protein
MVKLHEIKNSIILKVALLEATKEPELSEIFELTPCDLKTDEKTYAVSSEALSVSNDGGFFATGFKVNKALVNPASNVHVFRNWHVVLKKENMLVVLKDIVAIDIEKYLPESLQATYRDSIGNMDQVWFIKGSQLPDDVKAYLIDKHAIGSEVDVPDSYLMNWE